MITSIELRDHHTAPAELIIVNSNDKPDESDYFEWHSLTSRDPLAIASELELAAVMIRKRVAQLKREAA